MKKHIPLALLTAIGGAFAFDPYLPVAKGHLEIDGKFQVENPTGYYDEGGDRIDGNTFTRRKYTPSLQLKYGIHDGLDVEYSQGYVTYERGMREWPDIVTRPELALKYVHPDLGVGGYLNVALPMAIIDGHFRAGSDEIATTITAGAIYGRTFDRFRVNGLLGYQYNTEGFGASRQDAIEAYAQGQYDLTDRIGPYLGVDYIKTLGLAIDGQPTQWKHYSGYLLTLKPGMNLAITDKFAAELSVPATVSGSITYASWSVNLGASYTFGL